MLKHLQKQDAPIFINVHVAKWLFLSVIRGGFEGMDRDILLARKPPAATFTTSRICLLQWWPSQRQGIKS